MSAPVQSDVIAVHPHVPAGLDAHVAGACGELQRVGADVLLMTGVHIGHDCHVGEGSTIGSHTALGGYTIIGDLVTFGQGVVTHPWIIVGEAAMVGLNSSVIRDVQPFAKVAGSPARLLGSNTYRDSSLPAKYDFDALGSDVVSGWNDLLDQRAEMKIVLAQR